MTLLTVSELSVTAGSQALVRDLDLQVDPGERVGLIGESGSGKTVTCLSIIGLLSDGLRARGSVRLTGVDHELLSAPEPVWSRLRGSRMSMIFQEPMTALNPVMRIGRQVAEMMTLHGETRRQADARAVQLLDQVGLPDPAVAARAYPHQLSGGQRQRVMLAMAMANSPDLLLADEPTTALDVTVQAQVLDLMRDQVRDHNSALLFITHDLAVVSQMCDRVLIMKDGVIVESGTIDTVFSDPQHPYTRGLLAASALTTDPATGRLITVTDTTIRPGGPEHTQYRPESSQGRPLSSHGGALSLSKGSKLDQPTDDDQETVLRQAQDPASEAQDPASEAQDPQDTTPTRALSSSKGSKTESTDHDQEPALRPAQDPAVIFNEIDGEASIRVRDLGRVYHRGRTSLFGPRHEVPALQQVSFDVAEGTRFGVVGESGSGKSTLLRLLCGLDSPTAGSLQVAGQQLAGARERDLRSFREQVQLVFQDPHSSLDPRMRVRQVIAEPLRGVSPGEREKRVAEMLQAVGLPAAAADRFPHQFSGGQRQRIAIARALITRPRVLLADEPVSALDVSVRAQVLNLLAELVASYGLTMIFVSHDLNVVRHLCDTVAVMRDGRIVECGPTETVYADPKHPYTRELITAVPRVAVAG